MVNFYKCSMNTLIEILYNSYVLYVHICCLYVHISVVNHIIQNLYICDQQTFSVEGQLISRVGCADHMFVAESSHR